MFLRSLLALSFIVHVLTTSYPSPYPTSLSSFSEAPTTLAPTNYPISLAPTRFPTSKSPTASPTPCTASCPIGHINANWRADRSLKHCRIEDLKCVVCPEGFWAKGGDIFSPCIPCSTADHGEYYCTNGKRYRRTKGLCTSSSQRTIPSDFDFFESDPSSLEEWKIRDRQSQCGKIELASSNIHVEVVKPTSAYFDMVLTNIGDLAVRVNRWKLPNYMKFYDSFLNQKIENLDIVVYAKQKITIKMVLESSSINGNFVGNDPIQLSTFVSFTQVQEFRNGGLDSSDNKEIDVKVRITIIPPSLSILPDEYKVRVDFHSVSEHFFTLYSANYNRINWTSSLDYSINNPTSNINWIALDPAQGEFAGYECRNNDIVSKGQNSDHATIRVVVNSNGLPHGDYLVTIFISNGYKSVQSKLKISVDPGPMIVRNSLWQFGKATFLSSEENKALETSFPYTNLKIIPRDMYGSNTTNGVDHVFVASWTRIEAYNNDTSTHNGSMEISFDQFENTFEVSLNIPRSGDYMIEVVEMNSKEHIRNSPFRVSILPRECKDVPNSVPDPLTGKSCVCSPGYGRGKSSNTCSTCSIGTYRDERMISEGIATCEPCPPGTYQDEQGSSSCKQCSGRAQPNQQRTLCEPCKGNEVINVDTKFRLCEPCGTGYTVIGERCACRVDFYDSGNRTCIPCPKGAFCGYGDQTTVFPLQGYWQAEWDPLKFLKCRIERACKGITTEQSIILSTTEGWEAFEAVNAEYLNEDIFDYPLFSLQANNTEDEFSDISIPNASDLGRCSKEFKGPLCYECSQGYFKTAAGDCIGCGSQLGSFFTLLVLLTLGVLALFYLIRKTIRSKRAFRRKEVMVLKIVISHLQIIALVQAFPFEWPVVVHGMFSVFDTLSSAGSSAFSLSCLLDMEHDAGLNTFLILSLTYWLLPMAFAGFFAFFWFYFYPRVVKDRCSCFEGKKSDRSDLTTFQCFVVSNIVLLFVLHPVLTKAGLRFFSCTEVSSKSFLEAEFSIECNVGEHLNWIWLGACLIGFYAVGIPLLGLFLMVCIVRPGVRKQDTKIQKVYGFIFGGYRDGCLFWEIVIMTRKATFALIAVVLKNVGIDIQAYLGILVIVISWLLHTQFRPYNESLNLHWLEGNRLNSMPSSNNSSTATSLAVTFSTLFAGMFLISQNSNKLVKEVASVYIVVSNVGFLFCSIYCIRSAFRESIEQWYFTAEPYLKLYCCCPDVVEPAEKDRNKLAETARRVSRILRKSGSSMAESSAGTALKTALEDLAEQLTEGKIRRMSQRKSISSRSTDIPEIKLESQELLQSNTNQGKNTASIVPTSSQEEATLSKT